MIDVELKSFRALNMFFLSSAGTVVALAALILMGCAKTLIFGWDRIDFYAVFLLLSGRSFFEWFLHRYIWHALPLPIIGVRLGSFVSRMHAEHHKKPWDVKTFLFGAKAHFVVAFGGLIFWIWLLGPARGITVAFSFVLMVLIYEWFHLLAHSTVSCNRYWIGKLSAHHKKHHHEGMGMQRGFGVSSLLADRFFQTL